MDQQYPLQLERYFFTHQEVTANPEHDQEGIKGGSFIRHEANAFPVEGAPGVFSVEAMVMLDQASSENPPYFFNIQAFGFFHTDKNLPEDVALQLAQTTGVNILLGAIRERFADLTARAPWGTFFLPPFPLTFTTPTSPRTASPGETEPEPSGTAPAIPAQRKKRARSAPKPA